MLSRLTTFLRDKMAIDIEALSEAELLDLNSRIVERLQSAPAENL
jgi:hypothetical protein